MEYIAVAVVFGILFGCFTFLDGKRKEQEREINGLYEAISSQNDRISTFHADRNAIVKDVTALKNALQAAEEQIKGLEERDRELATRVGELAEPLKAKDRQEKLILEGMNSILNYSVGEAMRAAKDVSNYGEEE